MENNFKFNSSVVALPLFSVLLLWIVFWMEIRFDFDFDTNGIYPRTILGLQGVIFSPFIHADIEHLYNNSIPLLILLASLRYFYNKQSFAVIGYGILLSGLITWVIGRENYHIGASGLIYVLVSFIFFKGIQTQYYRLVALSLTVILLYGGLFWYIFPKVDETISWEGHLAGFLTGFALSIFYKTPEYKKIPKYNWEQPDYNPHEDKFMQRFDEHGNFVNLPPQEDDFTQIQDFFSSSNPNIAYTIVDPDQSLNQKNDPKPEF
jgi:membrane associated rhomboid family serine protease